MNVDPQEIAKFEALASRWWDRDSEFKPLHDINPLRANYIDRHSPVAGRRLVDVGCGGGILAEAMALRGATVTGIDMGEAPLSVARLQARLNILFSSSWCETTSASGSSPSSLLFSGVSRLETGNSLGKLPSTSPVTNTTG